MGCMVSCGGVPRLVQMITAEHAVMQTEALLALTLLFAMRMVDAEPHLIEAKVGEKIVEIVTPHIEREVFQNVLALVGQLSTSGNFNECLKVVVRQCIQGIWLY